MTATMIDLFDFPQVRSLSANARKDRVGTLRRNRVRIERLAHAAIAGLGDSSRPTDRARLVVTR